eukprot:9315436-Ditylum_brightwellii.AAC.1
MGACCSKHHCYTGGEGVWDNYCKDYETGVARENVTSVYIYSSLKRIGNGAFYGCRKIKSITIPDNVQ